jgi:hypothetical protein
MKKIILSGLIVSAVQLITFTSFSQTTSSDQYQNYQSANYDPSNYQDDNYDQSGDVSYQTFYDDLSPYGQWIDYPNYGYVWQPSVGADFKPYATNGHWVYTDMGWTWVSDYNWGWATFHYGRWFYDNSYGWLWVPGYDWAPAWVSWRSSNDYYGWAPLMPNISFSISLGSYNPPVNYWCFVPHEYIASNRINNYYVNVNRNTTIINSTTIINNRINNHNSFFAAGPNAREVEQFTHSTIRPLSVRNNNRPGSSVVTNNELRIFRPRVRATSSAAQQRFAPANVRSFTGQRSTVANNNVQTRTTQVLTNNNAYNRPAFNNNNRVEQNNTSANVTQNTRQNTSQSFFMNRRNDQPVNNTQRVNNNRSYINTDNIQRQAQHRNSPFVANNSSSSVQQQTRTTMPVNRTNGNAYHQSAPVQQRVTTQQIPANNRSMVQAPANRSVTNNRTFNRR